MTDWQRAAPYAARHVKRSQKPCLAARDRVRKRDISLSAHSIEGIAAWDTFQSIVATVRKLGVGIVDYIQDRLRGVHKIPRLADLIRQKAAQLHLGASWEAPLLTE